MPASSSTPRALIAPDKFKGTLTARAAAQAMAEGFRDVFPDAEIDLCPIADGGEGTLEALAAPLALETRTSRVVGPLGEPVEATWGINPASRIAVVELAQAAGLWRVPRSQRDPTRTITFGVGELVLAAVEAGAARVLLGLGGSATCDGGYGVACALGVGFRDVHGAPLSGRAALREGLARVATIDTAPPAVPIEALCDVDSPLVGRRGAACAFAPQKGATPADVEWIESLLRHLSRVPVDGRDVSPLADLRGAGAAGGVGFGLAAWYGAALRPGAQTILEAVQFERRARAAQIILTGEGRLDETTFEGKAVGRAVEHAAAIGRPVVVVAGSCVDRATIDASAPSSWRRVPVTSVSEEFGSDAAMNAPAETLREATRRALRSSPR